MLHMIMFNFEPGTESREPPSWISLLGAIEFLKSEPEGEVPTVRHSFNSILLLQRAEAALSDAVKPHNSHSCN